MSHEKNKPLIAQGGAGLSKLRSSDQLSNNSDNLHMEFDTGNQYNLHDDQIEELFPSSETSSLSSSPPRVFDVNPESQYMPILNDQDYVDEDFIHETAGETNSSIASSSLSMHETHHHDYDLSPVIFDTVQAQSNTRRHQPASKATSSQSRVIRCPVCEKPMRTFYCAKCIQTGKFVTLDHNQLAENRFSQTTIQCTDSETSKLAQEYKKANQTATRELATITTRSTNQSHDEMLQIKFRALKRKTESLKTLYQEQQFKLEQTKRLIEQTRQQVELDKKSHKSKESKIELIKRFIASRKASVKKREDAKADCLEELRQQASRRVYQLTQDVFPLDEVNLFEQQNSSFVNMETSPLLTFSDGSHHQIEQLTAYSIVEPWLPSNGDYSAYSLWVNDNKDQLQAPVEECSPERSPAFRIGAALAYTTQFVRNLANYLDVILPAQLNMDTFNKELLEDSQFSYNVAKLNANVIHLCVSQGIDLSLLQPHRTLKNLSLLFNLNLCDLGRKPLIDLEGDDEVARRIDSQLANDLSLIREEFYDFSNFANDDHDDLAEDECASDSEWEISDNITSPMDLQMVEQSQIQQNASYISRPLRLFSSFWTASSN